MNRQKLIDAYFVMLKLNIKINMSHDELGVVYDPVELSYYYKTPGQCNLLDAMVICAENCTGDWRLDVARQLDTSPAFIDGFIAGLNFKVKPEDKPTGAP